MEDITIEDQKDGTPFFIKLILILVLTITGIVILRIFDDILFNSEHYYAIALKPDCEYKVPAGYKIVYSQTEKMYAVKVLNYEDNYLTELRHTTDCFSSIKEPTLFYDSCHAKTYLKEYIQSLQPKFK